MTTVLSSLCTLYKLLYRSDYLISLLLQPSRQITRLTLFISFVTQTSSQTADAILTLNRFELTDLDYFDTSCKGEAAMFKKGDDLKRINRISPAVERRLHCVGIYTYAQLAALSPADIAAATA